MKRYLKYDGLEVLAHRGGAEESLENTIESFEYSISLGCKYIETDVQVSSDGIPYIFHDDDLKRICGIAKKFDSLSSQDIDKISIFDGHKIPRLNDVLELFPDTKFQIDFKTDEVVQPALDVISNSKALERVCIASFNSKRLKGVRKNYPNLCISMGPKEVLSLIHI